MERPAVVSAPSAEPACVNKLAHFFRCFGKVINCYSFDACVASDAKEHIRYSVLTVVGLGKGANVVSVEANPVLARLYVSAGLRGFEHPGMLGGVAGCLRVGGNLHHVAGRQVSEDKGNFPARIVEAKEAAGGHLGVGHLGNSVLTVALCHDARRNATGD